ALDNCYRMENVILETAKYSVGFQSQDFNYFVLYNGKWAGGVSVALEPMTGAVDCFHNGIGLKTVKPGETLSQSISLLFTPHQ
ncbi:MAG: aldose 1-epimerase, partial [Thermoplasmataceae archaeon]